MTDLSGEIWQDRTSVTSSALSQLHIRPLGICSRFADRGLSVFVIEGLLLPPNFFGARRRARNDDGERGTHQQDPLARQQQDCSRSGK